MIITTHHIFDEAREHEQAVLLSLSTKIATIRDKQDLLDLLLSEVKPLFRFDNAVLALYDETLTYTQHLYANEQYAGNLHYQPIMMTRVATAGNPHEEFATYPTPRIVSFAHLKTHYPHHVGVKVMESVGLLECVIMPLRYRSKLLAILELHSLETDRFSDRQLPLFCHVADQMAVAVANILANEKLLEREQEKSLLLSVSEAIAAIRDKEHLLEVILTKIKPVFDFYDCGLFVFDASGQHLEDLAVSLPTISPSEGNQLLAESNKATFAYQGSAFEWLFEQLRTRGEPLLHNYGEIAVPGWADYVQAPVISQVGYDESLIGLLKAGGREIGIFMVNSRQKGTFQRGQFGLFQAITDQIAVAVANILANEEIIERDREKGLQIKLTNILTNKAAWPEKMVSLGTFLQTYLSFDYFSGWLEQGQSTAYQGIRRVGMTDYQSIDADALTRMTNLATQNYTGQLRELSKKAAQVITGDTAGSFGRQYPLVVAMTRLFTLESTLLLPVQLASQTTLLVWLGSKKADAYTEATLDRFRTLVLALSPTLEKMVAYEEIRQLKEQLEVDKAYLTEELKTTHNFDKIIGESEPLEFVFRQIRLVAPTDSTVLLEGETGTGKELFARAIHSSSPRKDRVLVKVNCAALPANLIESELFGHEKGAFTGAIDRRIGKFELANGGTLFLDEIGEMPLDLQPKLLRALQEKEIERVGGRQLIHCNVRIIAATNRNLEREVAEGRFRQDLFYRLNVFAIALPPLRQRPGDIALLASHFLHKFAKRFGRPARSFSATALRDMQAYNWPGNIRELEHMVEQALIISDLPIVELAKPLKQTNQSSVSQEPPPLKTWQDAERDNILAVLNFTNGRIRGEGGAAELLGINASTLDSRMKTLHITKSFGKTMPPNASIG